MDDFSAFVNIDGHAVRKYFFKCSKIPRLDASDPKVEELISMELPVVITNLSLIDSAQKWNLEHLRKNIGDGLFNVFFSENHKFMYYDDNRAKNYPHCFPATERRELNFEQFYNIITQWRKGYPRLYLQQMLNDSIGKSMVKDFSQFNWDWLRKIQCKNGWGQLTSNLLLIGLPGNVTPVHYDEQHNFFCQITGHKRCILFHPEQFKNLYPFPVFHPCDRQSQVDFDYPDFERFPQLAGIRGYEAIVGPGEVLYIPLYWWHYIESCANSEITTSINFWYRAGPPPSEINFPRTAQQKVAIMRNIEKLIGEALGSADEVGPFVNAMVKGRYDDLGPNIVTSTDEKVNVLSEGKCSAPTQRGVHG